MKSAFLKDMTRGWFVGDFEPSLLKQQGAEVGVKLCKKGEKEASHYHKIATEITVVVSGKVKMLNKVWLAGDIVLIEPGEVTAFESLEDSILTVVKIPGVKNDKYLV